VRSGEAVGTAQRQALRSHWPADLLDRSALPYSEPDWQALDGCVTSGQPLRLRLYISAHGEVERVQPLQAAEEDSELLQRLDALFRATRYVPGRRDGVDVASYTDILIETAAATLP
jgi:hypothetical protein